MSLDTSGLYATWPIGAEVRADGKDINKATQAYGQLIIDSQSTWTALDQSFRQPESQVETAKSAYDDLIVGGAAIGTAGSRIRDALVTYGDAVDDLQRDRRLAKTAAREYNAAVAAGEEIPGSGTGSREAVQAQIDSVTRRLQEAMDTCAETLNGLELELDVASFVDGPVPNIITTVLNDGLANLSFSDISYTDFHHVETIRNPTVVNRLTNTSINIGTRPNFPFFGVDVDTPTSTTSTSTHSTTRVETRANFLLPAPMGWMGKIPGRLGDRYRARVDADGRAHRVETSRSRVRDGGVFSRNGTVTTTTTTTHTDTSNNRWRPGDSTATTDGWRGGLNRAARVAGPVGDVVGVAFTFEGAYNEHYEEFSNNPEYANLSPVERENEVLENTVVTTVTDTGIDLAAGGTGAAIGAAVGGPVGAVVGFGVGLGLSWASDQDWFGGKSVKDWASDGANDAVDGIKDKWNDWFG